MSSSKKYFVSTSGSDSNPGTIDQPFGTITKGINALKKPGDVLNLREGTYVESVVIKNKHGSRNNYIVIQSHPGEHALIEGCISQFREADNDDWKLASSLQVLNAHQDEYVSAEAFTLDSDEDRVNRGVFLDRDPYTRLITYSKLDDLRADNQTFDRLPLDDPRDGPDETDEAGNPTGFKRPWVYMGPGLFFNQDTHRVHIRLSHTGNDIEGLADYKETIDPTQVRLAISHKDRTTLVIRNSSFLRFENLSIRFGGEHTVEVHKTEGVIFNHVRVRASSHGVFMGAGNKGTVFCHCELDGGLPDWYFRSDRKAEYHFKVGDTVISNLLGKQTSRALLFGNPNNSGIEMHNCEFVNAHDLYLFGNDLKFHHNWLHNLNDEAIFIDAFKTNNLKIYHNVITQCLSALSFAGKKVGGPKFIYRNLIDLRSPTIGRRPRFPGDKDVFRFGHLYKSDPPDGPLSLFQNTFLVFAQDAQASYLHYRNLKGQHLRCSFNNIFIAVDPGPITFVPSPSFPGPTDGNCYFRIGSAGRPLFRFLPYTFNGVKFPAGKFADLKSLQASDLFKQSQTQYPPGYEINSIDVDPRFRQMGADGGFQETDDLRLRANSPARHHGIVLPPDLKALDTLAPATDPPDIGCYPFASSRLQVGVDGRRQFPKGNG